VTTTPTTTPKPRRRWLQFSLRTLMVLMLVFGCAFGWLAYEIKQARDQRNTVKAFDELGGWVSCEPTSAGMIRTAVAWVGKLLGEDLSVDVCAVYLANNAVTDAELDHLRGLTQLRQLFLHSTQVTDAGLEHLRRLSKLELLALDGTQLTDAGVEHLGGLTQLQYLSVNSTHVTDAGLEHLRGLTQLQKLHLFSTHVTAAGVGELQKALPNCQITR
jgi:internalin A